MENRNLTPGGLFGGSGNTMMACEQLAASAT